MKIILRYLLVAAIMFAGTRTYAQVSVSGTVTDEKSHPAKGAVVFISGSERVMTTDENGKFIFAGMPQGTFQLSVQLMGYSPLSRNIIVRAEPINVQMQLQVKSISLNEVIIGNDDARAKNLKLFEDNFLGTSENAKQTVILNPKVINFSTKKGLLLADADEFLIIENKRLGYRIHYQLKDFGYNAINDIALYHGEYTFEQLKGTDAEKSEWAKNRFKTYQGSFMHYLRSVYSNTTLQNGFITKPAYGYVTIKEDELIKNLGRLVIDDRPVKYDSLVTITDTNFVSFKFKQLYVVYDPAKAMNNTRADKLNLTSIEIDAKASVLNLGLKEALIDRKGSYTDYRDFFIHGNWAKARVADQLPVEYQPPIALSSARIISNDATDKLSANLQRWADSIPQEKTYLHMDKPYYALGDTIWFKGYVTIGSRHQLSALSGAVYVDLINAKDSVARSLKLPITSGMVIGNFILGDNLKEGSYHISAYTQWMRNAGEDYFFNKTFTVGKPVINNKQKPGGNLAQSDVQFFPESGNLINGLSSRIAFKAVGTNGLGVKIKVKVTDNANNSILETESLNAGMGSFLLRPEVGKIYSANVVFEDGSTKTIALPKAVDDGYTLSVYQPNKDSILVRINASPKMVSGSATINFVAQSGGENIFSSGVKIATTITSLWLEKKMFPSGIAQFTLFNKDGEPLNERIAFIRSQDEMQLGIKTVKANYKSKERVLVDLDAKDSQGNSVPGNFSVAVIDESKVPVDESLESTIFSNILLTSDLKGYVEKPNFYFTNETDEVNRALDNLMLTQGYRRFAWKELASTLTTKPTYPVEGLGVTISGTVQTLGHKILPGANVMLVSTRVGLTKATTSDENGRFKFEGIFMTDSIKFAIQARSANNSDKVKILIDSLPHLAITPNKTRADISTINTYLETAKTGDGKPLRLDQLHALKEIEIKAKKVPVPDGITPQGMFKIPEVSADKVIVLDNPQNSLTLAMALQGRLQGISVAQDDHGQSYLKEMGVTKGTGDGVTLFVDGRKTSPDEASRILDGSIPPEDVAKIEVVRTNLAMVSFLGGPSILILTKLARTRGQYNPNIANITPKGFNKVREFYSPRYDRPGNAINQPDPRTTIYWNPYLKTGTDGKTSFNYFNADGPGTYKVIVEGINAAGELGRQIYRYTVNGGQTSAASAPPASDKNMERITAPLDSFNTRLPVEKVYLHLDKPYYNIGDTLWFKSYLVDRVNMSPSHLSGLLYVELDNDSSEMVRRISIPIKDGIGWGQIPLKKAIFREGGYTLRAYTNWMQNFGEDYIFNQRFYLGVPAADAWLVKSAATINRVADKDQLQVQLFLNRADKLASPVALKKVEVKIYDEWHYVYKEELQTGIDGSLKFSNALKDKADGRSVRVQITSLDKDDNNKVVQIPLNVSRNQNIDLQFLPESGNLVAGLKSIVGFKALGEDGKGTPVLGSIYDSKGIEVVSFAAIHNGMGSLEFTPQPGERYSARLSRPIIKSFELPKINAAGTVMHINNPEKGETIALTLTGLNTLPADTACYLVGTSRGVVYYSQKVDVNQAAYTIDKKLFPSGIARLALFKGKRPLNERAVFIDNQDQLSIKITPNKTSYVKRDSVGLEIEVKDKAGAPVKGNFSLAVTDDTQVKPDSVGNYGIATSLLINSELKGHVESPGYYINRKDKQAWQALDNLMLTQGWVGYDWKDVFGKAKPVKFEVQKEFIVKGTVTNLFKKPVPNSAVLLSSQKPQFVITGTADAMGRYEFKNLPRIDSGSFFLQASKADGKKMSFGNVNVERFRAPAIPQTLKYPVIPWYINTDSTELNYVKRKAERDNLDNMKLMGRVLKQVEIKSKKIIPNSNNRNGPGKADLVFDEKDIKEAGILNLYELMKQKLPGLKVISYHDMPTLMLNNYLVVIEVDGGGLPIHLDIPFQVDDLVDELSQFQIATFKGMEVMYSEKNMVKYFQPRDHWIAANFPGGKVAKSENDFLAGIPVTDYWVYAPGYQPGYLEDRANIYTNKTPDIAVIVITTGNGVGYFKNRAPNAVTYRPLPVLYPQQFYSPKYKVVSPVIEPDYRSTVFWEPNIITDQNGRAKVSFYTSDIKDGYTIKVAGTDANGGIGDGSLKLNQPKPN